MKSPQRLCFTLMGALGTFLIVPGMSSAATFASQAEAHILLFSNAGANTISRVDTGGAVSSYISSGLNYPNGLAMDSSGTLYESDRGTNQILKIPYAGVPTVFASGLSSPTGLALDSGGNLYEADGGSRRILKFTPGGVQSTFATGFHFPAALAFDSVGNLFVADYWNNAIYKITSGGVVSTFASGLANNPDALAFNASGILYVGNQTHAGDQTQGSIDTFTPSGVMSVFATGLNSPSAFVFDSNGNLYVGQINLNNILQFTPGGAQSIFATGVNQPQFGVLITNPEPSTFVLLGGGLALLGLVVRRKQS